MKFINKQFCLLSSIFAITGLGGIQLQAADLVISGTELMGANNVLVNGQYYDVEFVDGSYQDIYINQSIAPIFITPSDASLASQALLDQVLLDGSSGNFDTKPALTLGIGDNLFGNIMTPYGVLGSDVLVYIARNINNIVGDTVVLGTYPILQDSSGSAGSPLAVFALWRAAEDPPVTGVVPEPSTYLLMGSTLGILAFAKKRKSYSL
jgi:hypothetical protein